MPRWEDDPTDPGNDEPTASPAQPSNPAQPGPSGGGSPSWLPPGAVLNPDGSVRMPNGMVIPGPGPGFTRDPNTGNIVPATGPGGGQGPGTQQLSLEQVYNNYVQNHDPSSQSLDGLISYYKQFGYNAQRATHAGNQPSDDKLIINGQTYDFIKDVGGPGQAWQNPFGQQQGGGGSGPGGDLLDPWTKPFEYPDWVPPAAFKAPDAVTEQNDPGYKFRLEQGQQALERAAAAKGTFMGGGFAKDLEDYEQNAASAEYQGVYGRALTNYQTQYNSSLNDWLQGYNKALQGYQQSYNIFENNQAKVFNRLAALTGAGQTAAGSLNSAGLGYAGLGANTSLGLGNSLAGLYTGIGNSQAAGLVGGANAWSNFMGGMGNYAMAYPYMQQQGWNQSGYGGGTGYGGFGGYGGFMGQGGQYY